MKVKLYRQPPEIVRAKRNQFEKKVKADFIKYLYYKGSLNRLVPQIDIEAAKEGKVPVNFDIHHNHLIAYGGDNDFDNLSLVERRVHRYAHENIIDIQIKMALLKRKDEIDLFALKQVCLFEDCTIHAQMLIKRYEEDKSNKEKAICHKVGVNKFRPFDKVRSEKARSILERHQKLSRQAEEADLRMKSYVPQRFVLTPKPKKFVKRFIWRCSKFLHRVGYRKCEEL